MNPDHTDIDEAVSAFMHSDGESGSDKLSDLLSNSEQARDRFLDHIFVQSFIIGEAKAGIFNQHQEAAPEPKQSGNTTVFRRWWIWMATAGAGVMAASIIMMMSLMQTGRAEAALQMVNFAIAVSEILGDRTYTIEILEGSENPENAPNGTLDGATLHLRGNDSYALIQPMSSGKNQYSGSDGSVEWRFKGKGPVRIRSAQAQSRGALPGHQSSLPFLDLRGQLEELRESYEIELLDAAPNSVLTGLRGVKWSRDVRGPKFIEIWFDTSSGLIHSMTLKNLPRAKGGPMSIKLELEHQDPLPSGFHMHDAYHEQDRLLIKE